MFLREKWYLPFKCFPLLLSVPHNLIIFLVLTHIFQWKVGDEIPKSWREFYMYNPCVPVDYKTVGSAFAIARGNGPNADQVRSIRILLRPGKYLLREALTVQSPSEDIKLALETMDLPACYENPDFSDDSEVEMGNNESTGRNGNRKRSSSATLRTLLCRTVEVDDDDADDNNSVAESVNSTALPIAKRAVLSLKTRRSNEPLIRIRQGQCSIKNIELRHYSHGIGKSDFCPKAGLLLVCGHS